MKREPLLVAAPFSGTRVQPYLGTKRYLSTGDLQNDSISFEDVTYEGRPSRADICVEIEDVLFARMKSTRKVLLIGEELQNIIVSTGFAILRPEKNVSAKYLVTYLKSDEFERQKEKYCSGAIQPAITNNGIQKLTIPLPPLDDQKRIAHLLGKVEGMIARRKQHLQQLDELLKSVFLEIFGDPVRNEKGWNTVALPQLVLPGKNSLKRGPFGGALKKEIFVESGFLVYEQNHALNGDYSFERYYITEEKYKELIDFKVEPNDILISCSGVYLGKLSIVPLNAKPGIINQALLKVSLNPKKIRHIFFVNVFGSPQFKNKYFPSNRGGAIPNLPPMTDMKKIPFISPPIELQNQFAAIVEKVESLKSRYQSSLANLENLYGALSQKAFKDELDLGRVPLPVEEKIEMRA